ncbi:MAG: class I SAM-dependent methyltransferase [Candidatus Omnitrophota bacterium]
MKEISGDTISNKDRVLYLSRNFIRGAKECVSWLGTSYFNPGKLERGGASPGRKYLNKFLTRELSRLDISKGAEVLDAGCGSGYIRDILKAVGYKGVYTGIDISESKYIRRDAASYGFKNIFLKADMENAELDRKFDVIMSVSFLEHVRDDEAVLSRVNQCLKPGGRQIHVVPTFWSLFLYLWHGYRQYTPERVKKLFGGTSYSVVRMGGFFSFSLHLWLVTIPELLFRRAGFRKTSFYAALTDMCAGLDVLCPICPSFYGIVARKGAD